MAFYKKKKTVLIRQKKNVLKIIPYFVSAPSMCVCVVINDVI